MNIILDMRLFVPVRAWSLLTQRCGHCVYLIAVLDTATRPAAAAAAAARDQRASERAPCFSLSSLSSLFLAPLPARHRHSLRVVSRWCVWGPSRCNAAAARRLIDHTRARHGTAPSDRRRAPDAAPLRACVHLRLTTDARRPPASPSH